MRLNTPLLTSLLALTAGLGLHGCGGDSSAAQEKTEIDFQYISDESFEDTGLTIATIEPAMVNPDVIAPEPGPDAAPFEVTADGYTVQAQMQIELMEPDATAKEFRAMFERDYSPKLVEAAQETINGILRNKGFEVAPVGSYDEITAGDDQKGFLASVPSYTIGFGNKTESKKCEDNICTQKGLLLIDGQYLYQMAEPKTGAAVAYRRMNLYGLRIEEPYTIQSYENDPGAIARIKQFFGAGPALVDTSEQALITGLNRLYKQTMSETDRTVSPEQLVALEQNLEALQQPAKN